MKKIGILGSGQVARVLGNGFLKHGYEVMLSSREPEKLADWKNKGGDTAHTGTFEEAARYGEIIVLAVLGRAAVEAIQQAGPQHLDGKTIIDNPISEEPPKDGVIRFFTARDESLMEQLQNRFPAAHFVKAFNSVGNPFMVNPDFKGGKPSMFICGNHPQAKAEVTEILTQFGWEVEDMGSATAAQAIEPLCILWCIPGFLRNQWTHAFRLVKV